MAYRIGHDFLQKVAFITLHRPEILETVYELVIILLTGWSLGWYVGIFIYTLLQGMRTINIIFCSQAIILLSLLTYLIASFFIIKNYIHKPFRQIATMLINGAIFLKIREKPEKMLDFLNSVLPYSYFRHRTREIFRASNYPLITWLKTFAIDMTKYNEYMRKIIRGRALLVVTGILAVGLFFLGIFLILYTTLFKSSTLKSLAFSSLSNPISFLVVVPYTFLMLAVLGVLLYEMFLQILYISKYEKVLAHHVIQVLTKNGEEYYGILNPNMPNIDGFLAIDTLEFVRSSKGFYFMSLATQYIPIKDIVQLRFYPITEFSDATFQGLLVISGGEDVDANRSEHSGEEDR